MMVKKWEMVFYSGGRQLPQAGVHIWYLRYGSVGLRAAYEEKYIRIRGMTRVSNPVPGTFADII